MLFSALLLFFSAFLGGLLVLLCYSPGPKSFTFLLLFAGGYLFSITVIHLLPELFAAYPAERWVGLCLLAGFFLQLLLELFSKGLEHGHLHDAASAAPMAPMTLLLALCIHAFFDGVVLSDGTPCALHHHEHGHGHGQHGLLLGIILHKLPVAFALGSVLRKLVPSRRQAIIYLALFAIASPIGLYSSHYCGQHHLLSDQGFVGLQAVASGGFLHIVTTIFFESSPGHHLNISKFMAGLAGACMAVLFELCM